MIYPKLSDGTIDWCVMCKHEGRDLYDGCCECEYPENPDDPPAKYEPKPITNADRIRSMTDEELAWWLAYDSTPKEVRRGMNNGAFGTQEDAFLWWLKQEATDA